ncbi:6,7-dimethyl-8-ribityllumazine synthase [Wohlfahrtiimonas chitiniclastica]|uniref:6,7-dimethyl-8-ribityllumazine synthase n=1 Tax=Wohlfahrtiimonas chitiniclastica TaxID=400946 RepID=UPI0007B69CBD|nr:6,7-dimethyl-8-ribityllumazine synthase [Wohlfahrtiimonas chitiniclastica]KZX36574.1 6,7-dimethyl-8-ribityllumazine synthase [Wohlfahrtiimonas chitiniclastica]
MQVIEGNLSISNKKIAIVAGRFNSLITKQLIDGAVDALKRHGLNEENIQLAWVPGAFEIPLIAQQFAKKADVDAVICLGAVIRGSTPHFDFVANEVSKGIASVSLESAKPIAFGVLTTDSIEQALERAGTKAGNKGADAAITVIEMLNLMAAIDG